MSFLNSTSENKNYSLPKGLSLEDIFNQIHENPSFLEENQNSEIRIETLSTLNSSSSLPSSSLCMITQQELSKDHITLPCGHSVNYIPFVKYLSKNKNDIYFYLQSMKETSDEETSEEEEDLDASDSES